MKPQVYLAGPIAGLTYDAATGWRACVTAALAPEIVCISPLRGNEFLNQETAIKTGQEYATQPLGTDKAITTRNRFDLENADLMLVNLLGARYVSPGTPIEFGWANAFGVPIIVIMEEAGNPFDHPMIRELAGWRVTTLDAGIEVIRSILSVPAPRTEHLPYNPPRRTSCLGFD